MNWMVCELYLNKVVIKKKPWCTIYGQIKPSALVGPTTATVTNLLRIGKSQSYKFFPTKLWLFCKYICLKRETRSNELVKSRSLKTGWH